MSAGPGRGGGAGAGTGLSHSARHRNLDLSKFCIGQKAEQLPSYDLYAVINHYGGMIGGHYTACARLPSDRSSQRSDVGEGRAVDGGVCVGGGRRRGGLLTTPRRRLAPV